MDRQVDIDIPAGTWLEDALIEWGARSGMSVMMNTATVHGKLTQKQVAGTINAKAALLALLEGSDMSYTQQGDRIRIVPVDSLVHSSMTDTSSSLDVPTATDQTSQSKTDGADSAGTDKGQRLEQVVVTAEKREERLQDVPISISVLGGNELDTSTSSGVLDELTRVPGIVIPPPSGLGVTQISIRGVGASGLQWDGASPVAYYLDSVPFGFVRSAYIPDSGAFDLSRVEVLRGPQGTLYGANAEDGVVRVLPNDADPSGFDLKARAFGSGTEYGGANGGGDVAVNVPLIEGRLAVRAVVDYQDLSGWINTGIVKDANDAQLRDYRLKVAYLPIDDLSIDLSEWSSRDNYGALSNSLPNRTENSVTSTEPVSNDFDASGAKVTYTLPSFSITSMTSYIDYRAYNSFDTSPYGLPFFLGLDIQSLGTSRVFSEEFLLSSATSSTWKWTAGVFYRDDHDTYTQTAYLEGTYLPPPTDFNDESISHAFFGQIGRRFFDDKFEWTLGLRQFHDTVSTSSADPADPSLGFR